MDWIRTCWKVYRKQDRKAMYRVWVENKKTKTLNATKKENETKRKLFMYILIYFRWLLRKLKMHAGRTNLVQKTSWGKPFYRYLSILTFLLRISQVPSFPDSFLKIKLVYKTHTCKVSISFSINLNSKTSLNVKRLI